MVSQQHMNTYTWHILYNVHTCMAEYAWMSKTVSNTTRPTYKQNLFNIRYQQNKRNFKI